MVGTNETIDMTTLQNPNTTAPTGAGNTTDASPDRGGSQQRTPRAILALLLAGALLQKRGYRIAVESGEAYPMAVRRMVQSMPPEQREKLRGEVTFLLDTDLRYGPFAALSKYQQPQSD
jgi:hypothetical protein